MRKNYRNYTRVIKQKIQSYFDISTNTAGFQVLQFNCGGGDMLRRVPGLFGAYKYFKLGELKITAVPASTLPVDPTGLSYEAGENTVDPRDQLTPGLIRITNGEDLRDFSTLTDTNQENAYNAMLLDPRWYKFMLQTGFKRSCFPKFWGIGQLEQDAWPGAFRNVPQIDSTTSSTGAISNWVDEDSVRVDQWFMNTSTQKGIFQTGQKIKMGWMPTDVFQNIPGVDSGNPYVNSPPEIQGVTVILPKQRKTRYYYRVFVTETIYFKDPVVFSPFGDQPATTTHNPIDFQNTLVLGAGTVSQVVGPTTNNDGDEHGVN